MKILLVNHTFPPESLAGSEICVLNSARELQKLGHEVVVFFRGHDPSAEEYVIRQDEYEDIPLYTINHTYRFAQTFQDIYCNSAIAARFSYLLHQIKPDIVHFHHLTNLSLSLVEEAKNYGSASVMTLHDYWLLCQRGQMLKRDLSLCPGPSKERCRTCLAPQLLRGRAQRLASKLLSKPKALNHNADKTIDLLDLRKAKINTPDRRFVCLTCFDMEDLPNETLQAHPPAEISYAIRIENPTTLEISIGMHPSTYDQEGRGVRFEIERNGRQLFARTLNPKLNPADHGWHQISIELDASEDRDDWLILRTVSESDTDNKFCTAGWNKPMIHLSNDAPAKVMDYPVRKKEIQSLVFQAAEIVTDAVAAFSERASEGLQHRSNWVNRVWDDMDMFISPSRFLRDFFIDHGLPEEKIEFLDNGFTPIELRVTKPVERPVRFGYIGTWIPSKGVDLVLQAFRNIDPADARLEVHGFFPGYDGYEDYEQYLQSLSSPAVEWKGRYKPHKVYDLLSELDCLIMASIWLENSPLTIHEAFQAKVPLLTADVGGMAELVRHGGGMTFHHRDAESLAHQVKRIVGNPTILDDLRNSIPSVQSVVDHVDRLLEIYTQLK